MHSHGAPAVRSLCEFTAKEGDLDLRFTPSPTAQEGIAGYQTVVARRGADYQAELPLVGSWPDLTQPSLTRPGLIVSGRADDYDPEQNLLEEIKTHRVDVARIPENHCLLHWAQVKVYGWLLCQGYGLWAMGYGLDEVELAVVYFNVLTRKETVFRECFTAAEPQAFFALQCGRFVAWTRQEQAHRQARDASLERLRFPYPESRRGQRQLAEAVYRAARDGHTLMAQATTGIGKACEHPDKSCHSGSCPLAQGFYDRLPAWPPSSSAGCPRRRCARSPSPFASPMPTAPATLRLANYYRPARGNPLARG